MKRYLLLVIAILGIFAISVIGQDMMSEMTVSTTHVETHPSQGDVTIIEDGHAMLVTNEDGLFAHMVTDNLEDGHVYTFWVVIVNNPEACEAFPCTAPEIINNSDALESEVTWGDSMIYYDGVEPKFNAYVPVGDVHEPWIGNGLTNPTGAEIHLVVNDHGEFIPEMTADMLGTYRGGCTDDSLPGLFPEAATSDGEAGPNTCRLIQDAIFKQ